MAEYFLCAWLVCFLGFHLAWALTRRKQNVTSVDVFWALGIALLSLAHAYFSEGDLARRILVSGCILFWGIRLAFHLWRDRVVGGQEDARYAKLRRQWGNKADRNFWFVFQVQGLLVFLFSTALWPSFQSQNSFGAWQDYAGMMIWALAIVGEALADRQLKDFKALKTGKTLQSGLWRYSRHPNYFFEWLHWFAYVFWAWGSGWIWVAFLAPFLMLWLLTKVSGIPAAEEQSIRSRGEEYLDYQRRTSAFIPWLPKKRASK